MGSQSCADRQAGLLKRTGGDHIALIVNLRVRCAGNANLTDLTAKRLLRTLLLKEASALKVLRLRGAAS